MRKEIEKGKKQLKKKEEKKTEKEKGDKLSKLDISKSVNLKKSVNVEDSSVDIRKIRKHSNIKAKAESTVKKILDLSSSDVDSSESTSSSSVDSDDSDESGKKTKKRKFKSKKKSGIFDHPSDEVVKKQMWPQSKLQFEYAGSKINFDELEFNLFVAGELEILSTAKISETERVGRTKLLKKNCLLYRIVRMERSENNVCTHNKANRKWIGRLV